MKYLVALVLIILLLIALFIGTNQEYFGSSQTEQTKSSLENKTTEDTSNTDKTSSDKISSDTINIDKTSLDKINTDTINTDTINIDKTSLDKISGSDKISQTISPEKQERERLKDQKVLEFAKRRLSINPNIEPRSIEINTKTPLEIEGWSGYVLDVEAYVKNQDKIVNVKDTLFSNGDFVTMELVDFKTGRSLKEVVTPNLKEDIYQENHLIAGTHNAQNAIVIFSDPLCHFCKEFVPRIIKYVKENNKTIGLYYYSYPLAQIYPASEALTKIMNVARLKGVANLEERVYQQDWSKYFKITQTDESIILKGFNTVFKTNIKLNELSTKALETKFLGDIRKGEELLINAVPAIYVNGKKDPTKELYKTLGK